MAKLENYSGYEIYEDGRIYSYKSRKWLTLKPRQDGYIQIHLINDDGEAKDLYLHRIVAQAFLPNPENLPCINHKDENRMNCHKDNLEWCTYEYNNNYGSRTERMVQNRIYETPSSAIQVAKIDSKQAKSWKFFHQSKKLVVNVGRQVI